VHRDAPQHRVEQTSADIVEEHVDTARTGAAQRLHEIALLVIDHIVEAEFAHQRAFLRATGNTHHARAEQALEGQELDEATIARAADTAAGEVEPMDDLQGTAEYRRDMLRVWVRRVVAGLAGGSAS
jgi:hypothetical protein